MSTADANAQAQARALRAQIAQFTLLANSVPVAIAYYEAEGNTCRFANRGYADMFGFDELNIIGLPVASVIGVEAAAVIQPQVDAVLRERRRATYERTLQGPDGRQRTIEVDLIPHLNDEGDAVGAFVLIADISRHRAAEAAVRESEERLNKFMQASAEGIVFHKGGYITDANPPLLALIGYTLEQLRGRHTLEFVSPQERERVAAVMRAGEETSYDSMVLHANGEALPVQFIVRTMNHGGEVVRMTIVRDIRDRLQAQARIQHLAHHDALTGLPNRLAFLERVQARLLRARARTRKGVPDTLAMLFIDLDHFKRVNDSLGHAAGDLLLQTVAQRITGALRAGDLVARFGGDEFVLLLSGTPTPAAVQDVAVKLLAAIGAPLDVGGALISVTPSVGVALYPAHGRTPAELIKHADTAMYRAKSDGRARWRFFEPAMAAGALADLAMEGRLAKAVQNQEFVLHFQPQLALADGRLIGVEALLRWAHPERGLVPPDEFIALAEARRLILPIGQWVLQEALRCAVHWQRLGLLQAPMAVNLSTLQFQAPGFVEGVQAALQEAGASGGSLELELTERMLMDDVPGVQALLARLKAMGLSISVDDFGTGYSSLAHLKDLPLDRLKIDRSFVQDLPGNRGSAAIARAIIQMGQSLGLEVVAEGVETPAQQAWVKEQGCDAQQGLLAAGPMPEREFEAWLRVQRPVRPAD